MEGTSHLSQDERWGRECNKMCPLEANLVSNALGFLTLRKPRSLNYWGLWSPTWAENIFFHSVFLHFYTFIDLLWIWTDTFLLILLNQPVWKYIIEGVACVCKIHNWVDWQKEVKGSFALRLHELLQLCFSLFLVEWQNWHQWNDGSIEREGWTGDINFFFSVSS